MGAAAEGLTLAQARKAAVDAVFALNRDVGIPLHLRDVGVRKEDIPALAQAAFDDVCTGEIRVKRALGISSSCTILPGNHLAFIWPTALYD
jgi:lactaldehyde reductase